MPEDPIDERPAAAAAAAASGTMLPAAAAAAAALPPTRAAAAPAAPPVTPWISGMAAAVGVAAPTPVGVVESTATRRAFARDGYTGNKVERKRPAG